MSRGQLGQTFTTIAVFPLTVALMFLFVAISAGFCLVDKCLVDSAPVTESALDDSLQSRVLAELFLSDHVAYRESSGNVRDLIITASSLNDSERLKIFQLLERHFAAMYPCEGNVLAVAQLTTRATPSGGRDLGDGTYTTVSTYLDYPEIDLASRTEDAYPLGTRRASAFLSQEYADTNSVFYLQRVGAFSVLVQEGDAC